MIMSANSSATITIDGNGVKPGARSLPRRVTGFPRWVNQVFTIWQALLQLYGYSHLTYEFSGTTSAYNDVPFHLHTSLMR